MYYNLTSVGNSSGILEFAQLTNSVLLGDFLGLFILIMVGVLTFVAFMSMTQEAPKAIAASAFILLFVSLILRALELTSDKMFFIIAVSAAAAIIFAKIKS